MEAPAQRLFRDCEQIKYGSLRLVGGGQVAHSINSYNFSSRFNDAVPLLSNSYSPTWLIDDRTAIFTGCVNSEVLYIDPKSRIPRDLLRNSGYKITISPEKADCIIIPEMKNHHYMEDIYHLYAYNPESKILYMLDLKDKYGCFLDSDDSCEQTNRLIEDKINELFGTPGIPMEIYCRENSYDAIKIYFVKPIESFLDIIEDKYPDREYCFDSKVCFTPTNDISIETLEIWSHLEDETIIEKCLCGCDWHTYPLTLRTFIWAEYGKRFFKGSASRALRMVLDAIHYFDEYEVEDMNVCPEDWNMLQTWIMYRLGTKDNGKDFVTESQFRDLSSVYRGFVRTRAAVSPMLIKSDCGMKNLKMQLNNS